MDTTILKLLFSYKGAITSREFRIGIALVFMSIGAYIGMFLDTSIGHILAGAEDSVWLATEVLYNQATAIFVPHLVPVLFIISYSSFMLAMKRARMLTNNCKLAVALGVLNYLFFASFLGLMMLVMQIDSRSDLRPYASAVTFLLCGLFLIGGINLLYLCFRKSSDSSASASSPKGRLDISGYGIKLGNLVGVAAIVSIAFGIAFAYFGPMLLFAPMISYGSAACAVVVMLFYIKYSVCRLKDANVSVLWLVGILVVYLVLCGGKIWMNLHNHTNLTLYYNTLFSIVNSFFILAQYALFLLPSKTVNAILKDENN